MLVQAVRIPVLQLGVAVVPRGGPGLLHPWKRERLACRQGTLERVPETPEHPSVPARCLSNTVLIEYAGRETTGQVRRHRETITRYTV